MSTPKAADTTGTALQNAHGLMHRSAAIFHLLESPRAPLNTDEVMRYVDTCEAHLRRIRAQLVSR